MSAATQPTVKPIIPLLDRHQFISTIDNFLRPRLIKNQTKLHELFVFFSVLCGISLFGLLGIVMGPVVLAITLGLLSTFKEVGSDALKIEGNNVKAYLSAKRNSSQVEAGT